MWSELIAELVAAGALPRSPWRSLRDHGWAKLADALRARLIPPDLDPDPLATVERLVTGDETREPADGTDGAQR